MKISVFLNRKIFIVKEKIQEAFQNENVLAYAKSSGKEIIFNGDME